MILTKNRVEWIDMAKGLGIIFVLLGHARFPDEIITWIYSFHMPLFFSYQDVHFL